MKLKKFTLLELLLVIAIILILLSLIIPMVIKAQRSAELVSCMNNLKSIGTATALFHKDNKRYFPDNRYDQYLGATEPAGKYLDSRESIVSCPMDPVEGRKSYSAAAHADGNAKFDFDLNGEGTGTGTNGGKGLKLSKVKRPASMVLMISKKIYDGDFTDSTLSNQINTKAGTEANMWHDLTNPKYPFISVSGAVKQIRYYDGMGGSDNSAMLNIIDFTNHIP
jgi:type II secretory pathway pseudopilin PulG